LSDPTNRTAKLTADMSANQTNAENAIAAKMPMAR
jgi:hypothetical protein